MKLIEQEPSLPDGKQRCPHGTKAVYDNDRNKAREFTFTSCRDDANLFHNGVFDNRLTDSTASGEVTIVSNLIVR
jgi:hypothetical protein